MGKKKNLPDIAICSKIYIIREHRVMLDSDLACLYKVETSQLKRAVRRNMERFPYDFMFELTKEEIENLRCRFGASSWGGARTGTLTCHWF
ncbi:MAG: ORF6N domain-containing protein [Bacteroidia bacterium]|nr:ORF6N domain-containing protein [Bacteroidia bacterium]